MTRGWWVGLLLAGCSAGPVVNVAVVPDDASADLVTASVKRMGLEGVTVGQARARVTIEVRSVGASCGECWVLAREGDRLVVSAGGTLGVQYGLGEALELIGVRFFHPWKTHAPETWALPASVPRNGEERAPEMARRGLHLHTLHPIEALYDFWVPGAENLDGALRTIDFVVHNRGNYLQWCALDDIVADDALHAAWRTHTRSIIDRAHSQGVKVGVALQLFGKSNLQQAYDLLEGDETDPKAAMRARWRRLLEGLPFDTVNLSFGEFFAADAQAFVDRVNDAYLTLQEVAPGTEMTATVHVGNFPELRVTYQGREQLYYFLVRYADPRIVPWVHSVMYFNLFDDAGLAYLHERFDEHREFLFERLLAKQPVGYFPESAYWVAFDNPVPVYLPLYVRSRFVDLQRIRQEARQRGAAALQDHVLFSSGWEWGYWQTDVATLRMGFTLPETWSAPLVEQFAAYGEVGAQVSTALTAFGDAQHRALIEQRLAAYLAGRDQIIDAGEGLGLVSQPDRVELHELDKLSAEARAAFATNVVTKLEAFAAESTTIADGLASLPADEPFLGEVRDGVAITAARARFVAALQRAVLAHLNGDDGAGHLARAETEYELAKTVVAHRRGAMHDPDVLPLLRPTQNPTFYDYGYLREADTLCFWQRERAQARNLVLQAGLVVPGCVL